MELDLNAWLHLLFRWLHVFGGILWVGQTYYFTWLDHRLTEAMVAAGPDGKATVFMVHSGGFYTVEKQKNATLLPQKLHWFRWEAAYTWMSGIGLLVLVYYIPGVLGDGWIGTLHPAAGAALALGILAVGFV